jgi:hypothetical protein
MKRKPLTRKQRRNLIDAWAKTNSLCAYLENKKDYTFKYDPLKESKKIFRLLDYVIATLFEDDL